MSPPPKAGDPRLPSRVSAPLIPMRDVVIYPHHISTFFVGRKASMQAVEDALAGSRLVLLAAQKSDAVEDPGEGDVFRIGTVCTVVQVLRYQNETLKITVQGLARGRITALSRAGAALHVDVEVHVDPRVEGAKEEALVRSLLAAFESFLKVQKKVPPEAAEDLRKVTSLPLLADCMASHVVTSKLTDRQALLEERDPVARAEQLLEFLGAEMEILGIQRKIQQRVKRQMDRDQKEYYLNLQKQAIQKELGDNDEFQAEYKELADLIAAKQLSKEARTKAERELRKLKLMSPMSSEAAVIRNYLDWLCGVPWGERAQEAVDLAGARAVLDEDHYGLDKVKERIVEYIAVEKLQGAGRGTVLCLVGPPGVGKTSLGSSVARACGRRFVRVSLGGVRDEAEIRGHRRTYIGAYPGKIVYGMKRAGVMNPVFLLDEVDKMTVDYRGDPAAALLEVLDPEQNATFTDHFLDVEYDLSQVMFITTANNVEGIPLPLLDRMELIELPGYTEFEKFNIARRFLLPRQQKACGLEKLALELTDGALHMLIQRYTKEAGVRNLEREIASLCRKLACGVLDDPSLLGRPARITAGKLPGVLGVPRFSVGGREKRDEVGLCNGLAFTAYGGDVIQVEVTIVPGKGSLVLTGKQGEVMQESARAAVSYLRNKAALLKIDPGLATENDIHIHFPEGAVPKDGPSAGITIAAALASAALKVPVRSSVALTGEITLRGKVLPVGGIKEKLISASRGRIGTVVMPRDNRKNLKDVPAKVLEGLRIVLVGHMDEVLREALVMEGIEQLFPSRGIVLEPERIAARPAPPVVDDLPVVEIPDDGEEARL